MQSFDRYTAGASEVKYFQMKGGAEPITRYEVNYTHPDGARREVTVNETGNLVAGPLVLAESVTDEQLQTDKPDVGQPTKIVQLQAAQVPPAVQQAVARYVPANSADVRYRRDTFADGTTAVGVHWVQPENGKRYWMSVNEAGAVATAPRLSSFQPADMENDGVRSTTIAWAQVPEPVKATLQPLTRGNNADAKYFQQNRGGKVFYGAEYNGGNNQRMWVRTDATGNKVAGPVIAGTGQKAGEAQPAAGTMKGDQPAQIPDAVQQMVAQRTKGGKNVATIRRMEGGEPVYFTTWIDAQGDAHQMRLDEKGQPIVQKGK